jgi:hypothetical protein
MLKEVIDIKGSFKIIYFIDDLNRKQGEWKEFIEGDLTECGSYLDDEKTGIWYHHDDHECSTTQTTFLKNMKHGWSKLLGHNYQENKFYWFDVETDYKVFKSKLDTILNFLDTNIGNICIEYFI